MSEFYVAIGDSTSFSKTVGEYDVYSFAGISGDFSPNHVDEEYMRQSTYGRRIAHGALLVGYMSTASTKMIERCVGSGIDETPVSLGYDGVRFLGPVFINDTVTVSYTIAAIDPNLKTPMTMSFSLGVQHEFPLGIFVEVNAVGNLGRFLTRNPGPVESADGELLSRHEGLAFYTVGQRAV